MLNAALKEINELKAQVNAFRLIPHVCGGVGCAHCDTRNLTAYQCLKQHNIALLNDIEQTYANGADIDFCDYFACYKVNLELDNE